MDWLSSSRPLKSVDFYQRKVVSFLFSAEGRDDFRCLNIPIAQLGFYSPLHFISCIPLEMCEPFKNDKLFLATSGELRKGDKVLLLEKGTEGIIRSAVFKGRRLGKSSEPEILLDGHRKTYTEEEVVPYKAHLRQQLGTSLVPEKEYDIRDGVLQWEEPSWEPGQEIYHTREKRWATILSHENNQRGRPVVLIKMEGTNLKKEKTIRISLQDLQEHGVPVRIPKRKIPAEDEPTLTSDSGSASLPSTPDVSISPPMVTDENEREVVEITHSPPTTISSSPTYAVVNKRPEGTKERQSNEQVGTGKVTYEKYYGSPVTPSKRFGVRTDSSESSPPPPLPTSPPPSKLQSLQRYETSSKLPEQEASSSLKPILRKKSSSTAKVRPATEYFPTSHPQTTATTKDTSHIYQDPDPLKFKSCNNLDLTVSDDDLEHLELVNYTNSLRSSARKIIQKQLANEVSNRATSLKLRPTNTRPHVAEIFTWDNDKMKMTKRLEPVSSQQPIYTRPVVTASPVTVSVHNNLSKCQSRSQPDIHRNDDQVDCSFNKTYSRPQSSMQHPYYQQSHKPNPLEFNFAPLSSSELVKKQLAVVNRVLEQQPPRYKLTTSEYKSSPSPASPFSKQRFNEVTGVSSDSSSPDNDSGRGSYQFIPETIKECDKKPTMIMNMCPVEKRHIEPNTNNSMMMNSENVNTSVNRRYTKNRSNSRSSSLPRHMSIKDDRDIVEEEVYNVPMPFNPGSIASVSGYGKGIQGTTNSSYADATLCALFACSNIFDMVLLYSKPGQVERGIKKEVRKILRDKIVTPLRLSAYCKSDNVTHLREAMLPLSSKMHSPLMDAQEFLYLLFDSALNTESFIEFSNGTKDFMHQIIARPKDRSKSQTVQFMLETSLGTSGLKFKQIPSPALFLCMPRCKGRLVYYEAIIPSLQLNVTRLLHEGTRRRPKQCVCEMAATLQCTLCHKKNGDMALDFCEICKGIADQIHFRLDHSPVLVPKSQKDELLNLHSIICTRGNRYVAFVKVTEHRLSPWLFFDSQVGEYPEVTLLEDFGRWLDSLEKQPGHFREFAKLHPLLKRIMTDSHIYIYSKAHLSYVPGQTESLVI